jgi:CheY-like chemotaxis protein
MLVDGAVGAEQRAPALRTIERNARALMRVIDDLLDVSRVMGGKLRLDVRLVRIGDIVQNAVETMRPAVDAKMLQLDVALDPAAAFVSGDPERLQQIVWNLLSNAVKFTPSGGRVTVTTARRDSRIDLAVADTGAGMSPDFLPYVFERFRQEDAGSKRRYGGLGLGLAIVRSLVELHGGSVRAQSDGEGRGATFTVTLPAATGAGAPAAGPAFAAAVSADGERHDAARDRLDGVRVLVVDDEPEARELFARILEVAGAEVTCAASAADALAALREAPQDVLLSDSEMPGIDGYTLLPQAAALAEARGERLSAIAVTAYSRPEDEARSLAAGFDRHVRKPVDPIELIGAVRLASMTL